MASKASRFFDKTRITARDSSGKICHVVEFSRRRSDKRRSWKGSFKSMGLTVSIQHGTDFCGDWYPQNEQGIDVLSKHLGVV